MTSVPLVASVADLPDAIQYADRRPTARWFVAARARVLGRPEDIPAGWNIPEPVVAAVAFSQAERQDMADKGEALPDGSYPIPNAIYIEKAVDDYNRTNAGEDVKKHIIQRAVDLKSTDKLPSDWVDPDHDGDNDLIASKDTDHDDAAYRKHLGLVSAIDFEALVAGGYYDEYGVEDGYDDYDSDAEVPVTASGAVVIATAFTADQRRDFAKQKIALPDGSFPIPSKRYLGKAIRAVGRATKNSKKTIRKHIANRAKALHATYMLPDSYKPVTADSSLTAAETTAVDQSAKDALRARVHPTVTAATALTLVPDLVPDPREALRARVAVTAGAEMQAIVAGKHSLAEDVEHGFDEALHPRGKDGKFITDGGRVVADDGAGHKVEGTVTGFHRAIDGSTHVSIKTDDGHLTLANAKDVSEAPKAEASLSHGVGDDYNPHAAESRPLSDMRTADVKNIAETHSNPAVRTAAKDELKSSVRQQTDADDDADLRKYATEKARGKSNAELIDDLGHEGPHAGGSSAVRDAALTEINRRKLAEDVGGKVTPVLRSDTRKAAEDASSAKQALRDRVRPTQAEPKSTRYRARELSVGKAGATHDVEDTHTGTIVNTTGRNRAVAQARELNRAEDAKTSPREHVNAAIDHIAKGREAMASGDLAKANEHNELARQHNAEAMKHASADDLAKMREAPEGSAGKNATDAEIHRRLTSSDAEKARRAYGEPYGSGTAYQHGDTGQELEMRRKGQKVQFFDKNTSEKVGPEHSNVAPSAAYAQTNGYHSPALAKAGIFPSKDAAALRERVHGEAAQAAREAGPSSKDLAFARPSTLNPSHAELTARAEQMFGSDRSKWTKTQLNEAASLGDKAALRELVNRNRVTAPRVRQISKGLPTQREANAAKAAEKATPFGQRANVRGPSGKARGR